MEQHILTTRLWENIDEPMPVAELPGKSVETVSAPLTNIFAEAATLLEQGELVAFPTETVYGLGADALNAVALGKIFAAKQRPTDNPLIAHVADMEQVLMLTDRITPLTQRLMETYWPGPLSILMPARADLPQALTAGLPHVAVRMPSHPVALGLIRAFGKPIAAPSANTSGRPSPTSAAHVLEDLAGKIAGVIDGGDCQVGIESTVIEVTDEQILILRPGAVDAEDLGQFGVPVRYDPHLLHQQSDAKPRAPGQKYRHYAPKGSLQVIFTHDAEAFWSYADKQVQAAHQVGKKVALLAADQNVGADLVMPLGTTATEAAKRLYRILRVCDQEEIDLIMARGFAEDPASVAILNRLYKASGGHFVDLR